MASHNIAGVDNIDAETYDKLVRDFDLSGEPTFQVDSRFVKDFSDTKVDLAQSKICYVSVPVSKDGVGQLLFKKARYTMLSENVIKIMDYDDAGDEPGDSHFTAFRIEKSSSYSVSIPSASTSSASSDANDD